MHSAALLVVIASARSLVAASWGLGLKVLTKGDR
jgi:hypothetical protein